MATDPNEPVNHKMLDEAVDAILDGMTRLLAGVTAESNKRFRELRHQEEGQAHQLERMETELLSLRNELDGLKAEFSATPSRREFDELKRHVDQTFPFSE